MLVRKILTSTLLATILMTIIACGSDANTEKTETETKEMAETAVENLVNLDEEPTAIATDNTTELAAKDVENTPEPPAMSATEKAATEKRKEERKEIIKEQVSNSPFKNQTEAVEKYKELAKAYLAGNNRWKEWDSNDPIFQSAKRNPEFADIIKKLDDEMTAFDDDDE